jgi:MOSC domain-containing protein YiiM
MGEQLVVAGIDVAALKPGDRLHLGDEAILEVVKPRVGCQRFSEVQNRPLTGTTGRMGVMLVVSRGGAIRVGDGVRLETKSA